MGVEQEDFNLEPAIGCRKDACLNDAHAKMVVTIGMFGGISPNNQACYMEFFSKNGGTAGALMGAIQFSIAGAVTALSALLPETLTSLVLAQAVCCLTGVVLAWWPARRALQSELTRG